MTEPNNLDSVIKLIIESHGLDISERFVELEEEAKQEGKLAELSQYCEKACDYYLERKQGFDDLRHASIAIYRAAKAAENLGLDRENIRRIYQRASDVCRDVSAQAYDDETRDFSAFLSRTFARKVQEYFQEGGVK